MVSNVQLQQAIDKISNGITDLKQLVESNKNELCGKIDAVAKRIDNIEKTVETNKERTDSAITALNQRIVKLEDKVLELELLPAKVKKLEENIEERTNRQLRETLIIKNVTEIKNDESYADTKKILADIISRNCGIPVEDVLPEIKRAHRESPKRYSDNRVDRTGKRHIYAAFHSWDLTQKIINDFRMKNIRDSSFQIYAEQKYGPLTTRRRNLALLKRKELKGNGTITAGYVAFPAKLMINTGNAVDAEGKKIYKLHTNFSNHDLE